MRAPLRLLGRRALGALVVLLGLAALGACGGGEDPTPGSAAPSQTRIAHKYGSTVVPADPRRIVTIGLNDHEPLLALGITPVGVEDWYGDRPGAIWPWAERAARGARPPIMGVRDEPDLERVAGRRPDLIIAQYSGITREVYDRLSQIAPVVAQPPDYADYAAPWQVMTRTIGRAVGRERRAEELVAGVEGQLAEVRRRHPEWARETLAAASSFERGSYSPFSQTDVKAGLFAEMGFTVPREITEEAGETNAFDVSSEQVDRWLDTDRVVWVLNGDDEQERISGDPLIARLPASRAGRALYVPELTSGALSFGTVLSIPYALERIVPALEAQDREAAGARDVPTG